jgi:biofilm PGA synthesis N-glycosyltransferase PgaC
MVQRLLVISPVRNEAPHFERVARAMAAQTRPPDRWLVVDDNSTDGTADLAERLAAEIPFLTVLRAPGPENSEPIRDRLAAAAAPRSFNFGLGSVTSENFTHLSKLDGDIELPPDYTERLLAEFTRDPQLGVAGGRRIERVRGRWRLEQVPVDHHVTGALKCYTRECFAAIGGMHNTLGWDTIDQTYARMHGFRTRTFPELVAVHHRPLASADGTLRGRARFGAAAYIVHFPLHWVALRSFKMAASPPEGLSGVAFLYGYLAAALRRTRRVEDPAFRRFVRRELRDRIRARLIRPVSPARGEAATAPRATA